MNDKFFGYCQMPNACIKADFIKSRIHLKMKKYFLGKGNINSFNKPTSARLKQRFKKNRIDYSVNEGSLCNDISHITATVNDSRRTLQSLDVTVLEHRKLSQKVPYSEIIKRDQEIIKVNLLDQTQFTAKIINGNPVKSPPMKSILSINEKKYSQRFYSLPDKTDEKNKRMNDNLPLIDVLNAFKEQLTKKPVHFQKERQIERTSLQSRNNSIIAKDNQHLEYQHESKDYSKLQINQKLDNFNDEQKLINGKPGKISLNNSINQVGFEKYDFYKRQNKTIRNKYILLKTETDNNRYDDDSFFDQMLSSQHQQRRLTTQIQQLRLYPSIGKKSKNRGSQQIRISKRFDTRLQTELELSQLEREVVQKFWTSKDNRKIIKHKI